MPDEQNTAIDAGDPRDELIREQAEHIRRLEEEIAKLKELLEKKADAKAAKKPEFCDNFSLNRNKKRKPKEKKKPKKKRGRKTHQSKLNQATEQIDIYPEGIDRDDCTRRRSQFAWRIVDGKAIYVCYHMIDKTV